jgi:hypothetical protein
LQHNDIRQGFDVQLPGPLEVEGQPQELLVVKQKPLELSQQTVTWHGTGTQLVAPAASTDPDAHVPPAPRSAHAPLLSQQAMPGHGFGLHAPGVTPKSAPVPQLAQNEAVEQYPLDISQHTRDGHPELPLHVTPLPAKCELVGQLSGESMVHEPPVQHAPGCGHGFGSHTPASHRPAAPSVQSARIFAEHAPFQAQHAPTGGHVPVPHDPPVTQKFAQRAAYSTTHPPTASQHDPRAGHGSGVHVAAIPRLRLGQSWGSDTTHVAVEASQHATATVARTLIVRSCVVFVGT